jgi:hypothetical protein
MYLADHYFICDYLQMRDWVFAFTAPLGKDHRDTPRGELTSGSIPGNVSATSAGAMSRSVLTNSLGGCSRSTTPRRSPCRLRRVSTRRLRRWRRVGCAQAAEVVRGWPLEFGLTSAAAIAHIEYPFATGDRVDVMFENHMPDRTVIEVEVEGERQICVGIHQAIKYRSLAAADAGYPLLT